MRGSSPRMRANTKSASATLRTLAPPAPRASPLTLTVVLPEMDPESPPGPPQITVAADDTALRLLGRSAAIAGSPLQEDEMSDRLSRLAPLTGLVFAALFVVRRVVAPTEPRSRSRAAHSDRVLHRPPHRASAPERRGRHGGAALFVFFAGSLYSSCGSEKSRRDALGAVALVGAGLFAAGLTVSGRPHVGAHGRPIRLSPATAQGVNTLAYDMFLPMIAGTASCSGWRWGSPSSAEAGCRAWLGWVLIVLGVIAASPAFPIAFFGLVRVDRDGAAVLLVTRNRHGATVGAPAMAASS